MYCSDLGFRAFQGVSVRLIGLGVSGFVFTVPILGFRAFSGVSFVFTVPILGFRGPFPV